MDAPAMQADTARARDVCTRWFGRAPDMRADPCGAVTPEFVRAAQAESIRRGFTPQPGIVDRETPDMLLPRLNAGLNGNNGEDVVRMILETVAAQP